MTGRPITCPRCEYDRLQTISREPGRRGRFRCLNCGREFEVELW